MKKIPTDLNILNQIYNDYHETFISFDREFPKNKNKYYLQIDLPRIGRELKVDPDIVYGRLLNLDGKYGFLYNATSRINLFMINGNKDIEANSVNFPLVETILAELKDRERKYYWSFAFALASLVISLIALGISILR
jgi:hypothetical protein